MRRLSRSTGRQEDSASGFRGATSSHARNGPKSRDVPSVYGYSTLGSGASSPIDRRGDQGFLLGARLLSTEYHPALTEGGSLLEGLFDPTGKVPQVRRPFGSPEVRSLLAPSFTTRAAEDRGAHLRRLWSEVPDAQPSAEPLSS